MVITGKNMGFQKTWQICAVKKRRARGCECSKCSPKLMLTIVDLWVRRETGIVQEQIPNGDLLLSIDREVPSQ